MGLKFKNSILKNLIGTLLLFSVIFVSCKKGQKDPRKNNFDEEIVDSNITAEWYDFEKAKAFEHISEVPFIVYSEKDHILLYTEPSSSSKRKNIANEKLNRYYGITELNDFFEIVFSIDKESKNTIKAYVSKEDFARDSQLSLSEIHLNSVRYLMVYEETIKEKTFESKGSVLLVSKEEFDQKKRNQHTDFLVKNPNMQLVDQFWVNGKGIRVASAFTDEEEVFQNNYIGWSKAANIEVFHQTSEMSMTDYYVGYSSDFNLSGSMAFSGLPVFYQDGTAVFTFSNQTEVGCDFILYLYDPSVDSFKNYLVVNFVNFKADFSEQPFWADSKTLYFTATHLNTNRDTDNYRYEYLKLTLK